MLERSAQGELQGPNQDPNESPRQESHPPPRVIDAADAYYLLNPDGDLAPTQQAFEGWFASLRGWQVTIPWLAAKT